MGCTAFCGYGVNAGSRAHFVSLWHENEKEQPMALSTACAVVLGYQHYENCAGRGGTRCQPYEKILLKLDGSEYSRAMRFDTHIARKNINDRVCFSFYDRNQYSHLKSSNITQWLAP